MPAIGVLGGAKGRAGLHTTLSGYVGVLHHRCPEYHMPFSQAYRL